MVLCLNQNTKPYHEHHVYVLLYMVNEKLNFIALILELSSNLFLVQILSSTTQLTIVIMIQLHLSPFHLLLDPRSMPQHTRRASPRSTFAVPFTGMFRHSVITSPCHEWRVRQQPLACCTRSSANKDDRPQQLIDIRVSSIILDPH